MWIKLYIKRKLFGCGGFRTGVGGDNAKTSSNVPKLSDELGYASGDGARRITVDFANVVIGTESTTFRFAQCGYQAPANLYTLVPCETKPENDDVSTRRHGVFAKDPKHQKNRAAL